MTELTVSRTIPAPPSDVWAFYTDHAGWTGWAGAGKVTLEREGSPERDGVGCVRVIRNPGVTVREEVIAFEAPHRMAYRLIGGPVPLADHEGEVRFEAVPEGTRITWRCRFRSKLPGGGWLLRGGIRFFFSRVLRRLEKRARAGQLAPAAG